MGDLIDLNKYRKRRMSEARREYLARKAKMLKDQESIQFYSGILILIGILSICALVLVSLNG